MFTFDNIIQNNSEDIVKHFCENVQSVHWTLYCVYDFQA